MTRLNRSKRVRRPRTIDADEHNRLLAERDRATHLAKIILPPSSVLEIERVIRKVRKEQDTTINPSALRTTHALRRCGVDSFQKNRFTRFRTTSFQST